jgi:hypothetical protein
MWDMFRAKDSPKGSIVAAEDAQSIASGAPGLVDSAAGVSWYTEPANDVDRAVVALCLLRRAAGGDRMGIEGGDDAVREVLEEATPAAVIWLASRVISYMDEHGFPEDLEPWLRYDPKSA